MPDENGETRRKRNEERYAIRSLDVEFNDETSGYLWLWYHDLKSGVSRIIDGFCRVIPWSEYHAWTAFRGLIVNPEEFGVLHEMDIAYCDEMNIEMKAYRERNKPK